MVISVVPNSIVFLGHEELQSAQIIIIHDEYLDFFFFSDSEIAWYYSDQSSFLRDVNKEQGSYDFVLKLQYLA